THPPRRSYLVTPQSFSLISPAVLKVTDESWRNSDGTRARGWLLRGTEGAPAVVFLHRYGADRSWLFNLGVKLNEAANFTILWPDLRGHGLNPPVRYTTFGSKESNDVLSALEFLRTVKVESGNRLIGNRLGLYGVELGGYAAMSAAPQDAEVRVLVLDSIPLGPDELLRATVRESYGIDNELFQYLAGAATRLYLLGAYKNTPSCELAAALKTQRVLLLSGGDAGYLRDATITLERCFPSLSLETKTDLPLTGFRLPSATGEQGEGYDRGVIEFFDRNLR
ncbi:MAG: alpha/beta hydrolase, partial [Pyrinomonadaceae bacterium]